jgi:hypothetical protein
VHSGWEYNGVEDLTQEMSNNLSTDKMVELLQEMFQNIDSWLNPE